VIDWREISDEKVDAPMLKVSFTPILRKPKAFFEIPFGCMERPADGREMPAIRWVDLSDDDYGLALINDSKYGYDVKGNTVRLTLVRTSYSPDPKPDYGRHEIVYSIYPHSGDWRDAQTYRRGYEVNHPLEAVIVEERAGGDLPEIFSLLEVKPANMVVSCVKLAEDSDNIIIRLYDAAGVGGRAILNLGFRIMEATEVSITEKEIRKLKVLDGRRVEINLSPFEIKTIKLQIAIDHEVLAN